MAPVACGVSHGEKNWFARALCFCECFVTPLKPVDRIISMLTEVWRRRRRKSIRHGCLRAHGVVATVNVNDFAGSGREPIGHQSDDGFGNGCCIINVPPEWRAI